MQHLWIFWWRRKNFPSLSVTVFFKLSVNWWKEGEMSLLFTSRFRLCLLLQAVWETEKSGVKDGKNVRGNWRWQIIVWNWKSCREDVAVEDEVAHCFSKTPNTTSFHLIASFHLTSFFSPFCSRHLLSILSSSAYDLCSNKLRCYICFIYIWKSSIASQWGDGVVIWHNTSLSRWCWVFLPELQGLVEWRHRECGTDFLPTAWPEKSISISYKTAYISLFILGPLQILDKNKLEKKLHRYLININ